MRKLEVHPTHLAGDRYLGGTVPAEQISELRTNRWPPEVALRDGRIGFVANARRRDLELFGRLHAIPVVDRDDTWSWIAEEFLDTEFDDAAKERTLRSLEGNGVSRDEVLAIRRFLAFRMLFLTFLSWEWMHYGLWDVLCARPFGVLPLRRADPQFLPHGRSAAAFRRWAEEIANRAPIRQSLPFRPEPDDAEVLRRLRGRFLIPAIGRQLDVREWQARRARVEALRDELLAAWSGAGRVYHGPRHLLMVLDAVRGEEPEGAFLLAAWFHDAVYDVTRTDNEEQSARWLERATAPLIAQGELDRRDVDLALRMVRATARPLEPLPRGPRSEPVRRFLDADFQVFASLPEDYERYVAGVRQEYASVPDAAFRTGRRAFLERLEAEVLRRGWFFRFASPLAESLARSNLAREIERLRES